MSKISKVEAVFVTLAILTILLVAKNGSSKGGKKLPKDDHLDEDTIFG